MLRHETSLLAFTRKTNFEFFPIIETRSLPFSETAKLVSTSTSIAESSALDL